LALDFNDITLFLAKVTNQFESLRQFITFNFMKLSPFTEHIITQIQEKTNMPVIFRHITPEHGGDVSEAFKMETSIGNFFLKKNDAKIYPGMLEREEAGL
jgi:hypothetical protein